jgi:hypothetical protein
MERHVKNAPRGVAQTLFGAFHPLQQNEVVRAAARAPLE